MKFPKGNIYSMGAEDSVKCEVRLYSELFKSRNPSGHPDGWLADINSNSLLVNKMSLLIRRVIPVGKPGATFQFIVSVTFALILIPNMTPMVIRKHLVFNRTVHWKE